MTARGILTRRSRPGSVGPVGWRRLLHGARPRALLACVSLLGGAAHARDATAELHVTPSPAGIEDRVTVEVVVRGDAAATAELDEVPEIRGLRRIAGPSTSDQTSIEVVGSRMVKDVRRTISLYFLPERVGPVDIPPLALRVGGEQVRTEARRLEVVDGSRAPPEPARDPIDSMFGDSPFGDPFGARRERSEPVEIAVVRVAEPGRVHVGEPVHLRTELWVGDGAVRVEGYEPLEQPARPGLWVESLPVEPRTTHRVAERHGRRFSVFTLTDDLAFATTAGDHELPDERWRVVYRASRSLFAPSREAFPRTGPLTIEVAPLPREGRPAGFSGLVGRFRLEDALDRDALEQGEAFTWTLRLVGTGNLRTAGALERPALEGFEVFAARERDEVEATPRGLEGARSLELTLIPRAQGTLTLPAVEVPYFDPDTDRYEVARLEARPVEVAAGAGRPPRAGEESRDAPAARPVALARDIRHLRPRLEGGAPAPVPAWAWWVLVLVPLAVHVGVFAESRRIAGRDRDPAARRRREARATLERALDEVEGGRTSGREPLAALSEALMRYLADRFALERVDVTAARLREHAARGRLDEGLVEGLVALLADLDAGRFGRRGGDERGFARRVRELAAEAERSSR